LKEQLESALRRRVVALLQSRSAACEELGGSVVVSLSCVTIAWLLDVRRGVPFDDDAAAHARVASDRRRDVTASWKKCGLRQEKKFPTWSGLAVFI